MSALLTSACIRETLMSPQKKQFVRKKTLLQIQYREILPGTRMALKIIYCFFISTVNVKKNIRSKGMAIIDGKPALVPKSFNAITAARA